jgi:methionine--tRNA ligase beta chain
MISIDDFSKVEITVGKILSAEKVEGSDKLLRLEVDFAEESPRQVISGIAKWHPEPEVLIGKKVPFVTNLEPRKIMGLESQAMIMAAKAQEGEAFSLLQIGDDIPAGTRIS